MAKIETTFIRPKELYTPETGETQVVYDGYQNNPHELITEEGFAGALDTAMPTALAKAQVIETTWQELKNKRDNGQLIAGSLYRITDYNCTTTQENTQSAGHQFDIVLLALSENKLAEEGWAMMHSGDTYFASSKLEAWKVWYCLDNDKSRFAWASPIDGLEDTSGNGECVRATSHDTNNLYAWYCDGENYYIYTKSPKPQIGDAIYYENGDATGETVLYYTRHEGTGVIYRLIDEFNNDIKYDFKNIQFKRKLTDGAYDADNGTDTWCYTLNLWYNDMCQDASIVGNTLPNDEGYITGVYDNKFGYAIAFDLNLEGGNAFTFALGDNVILSFVLYEYYGIYSNTIGDRFYFNTIGDRFYCNTIGNYITSNTIGNNFYDNIIGNDFFSNTIGNDFNENTVGNYFNDNTIGDYFFSNTIGNYFFNNTISDSISFKNYGSNSVELATKDDLNG